MKKKLLQTLDIYKTIVNWLILTILFSTNTFAQQTITGKITDSENNQGLPGVNIAIKGTTTGTSTDGSGNYRLSVPKEKSILVFSYVGYLNQEVAIANRTSINVSMVSDNQTLSEVVVVGYGNQERRDVTGAVATIKTQNLKDLPVTSIDQKMAGQVAGVQVNQVSGAPGSAPVIRIRGSGSLGAGDDPLYVIDGFPVTNFYSKFSNPLSTISPDDIESISILKDASSTAIYGSRGSNGVILITTKKGKTGAANIEFSAYTGIQTIAERNRVTMLTSEQFAQNRIDGQVQLAAIRGLPYNINNVAEIYRNPSALGKGTDWFKELTRDAPMQNYNLSITKGTENLRSAISIGYFNQQGTLLNNDFQRFTMRANIDANLSKTITVGLNIAPSFSIRNLVEAEGHFDQGIITQAYLNSPLPTVYQVDGSFTPNVTSPGIFNNANPVNMLVNTKRLANNFRSLANVYLGIEIIPNLTFRTTFNADIMFDTQDNFIPSFVGSFRNPPPVPARGNNYSARTFNWLSENTLSYSKTLKNHRMTGLLGYSVQKEISNNFFVNGNGYADDVIQTIGAALPIGVTAGTGNPTSTGVGFGSSNNVGNGNGIGSGKSALLSYYGRVTYAFKDKYLFNLAVRTDGSSKFGSENRWGTFPSASIGWRISEEGFFPKGNVVSDLKLRASFGLAGNNNIGNFTSLQLLGLDNYVIGGKIVTGQALNSLGNLNLGWEQSKQTDIGLDASLLKGKVNLVLEFYERYTQSMLQNIDIPASSGFLTSFTNLGNVRNRGVEISFNSRNLNKGKFHWDTDFNISFNRNNVINLGNRARIVSGENNSSVTVVDQPMGMFYGYKKAGGFFTSVDDLAKYPRNAAQTIGSIRFQDINGDGKIDGNDLTVIGNPYPDFTWGMTNRLTYGDLDFSVLLNGSQGGQIFDFYKRFAYNQDGVFNLHADVLEAYKDVNNQGSGNVQSTGSALAGDSFSRSSSDAWVQDASYMVVRNVTLGYNFKPKKYAKGFRLYFSGQNLLTVTGYKGGFPEVGFNGSNSLAPGVNFGSYPIAATYTLGFNCKF
ncbi:MAG: TonB-dependent receptor [Arcicella sp.]|nr:TonB-dependent receptor [Arcicella sp.]